jgi:hypothetical protein
MTIAELIAKLSRYPVTMPVEVFIDWPEDPHEESGWFSIDKIRRGGSGVQIDLVQ